MHLPEILGPLRQLHEQSHVNPRISQKLVHFIIMIVARHWTNDIWTAHEEDSIREGLGRDTVKALEEGRHPATHDRGRGAVYDFCTELLAEQARQRCDLCAGSSMLGEEGVVQTASLPVLYSLPVDGREHGVSRVGAKRPPSVPFPVEESHVRATCSQSSPRPVAAGTAVTAAAEERLGPIPPAQMTDFQKKVVAEFTKARPDGPFGFWWGYLRVPEVLLPFLEIQTHIHGVMETVNGALGEKLTHFAMLIAARHWTQQVIWDLHDKNAIKSGLKPEILEALAAGRRPANMGEDEDIVYDFCTELQQNRGASATRPTSAW